MTDDKKTKRLATFAGGCFWCMERDFAKLPGVIKVISGYSGGKNIEPSYDEVCSGSTGHVEAVQVHYDPALISYAELLDVFWRHIDPTDEGGQFVDRGDQYRTAVFTHDEEQRTLAEASKQALERSGRFGSPIATVIKPLLNFYAAEDYHQEYYRKQPAHYRAYRAASGRDRLLARLWDADNPGPCPSGCGRGADKAELKQKLSPDAYRVTQLCATEPPFDNAYWDNKRQGLYVDIVSGEPLFSSTDKFDSGTGWPSFVRPVRAASIVEYPDEGHGMHRIEVKSRRAGSHLGHVFPDGPKPTGRRYCINSAALRFIPKEELEQEGYGVYLKLFKD
ncbi:MAG: peptide-methionine (S)-S-oxide reductase MsrA [Syntrophaceae bacterium]